MRKPWLSLIIPLGLLVASCATDNDTGLVYKFQEPPVLSGEACVNYGDFLSRRSYAAVITYRSPMRYDGRDSRQYQLMLTESIDDRVTGLRLPAGAVFYGVSDRDTGHHILSMRYTPGAVNQGWFPCQTISDDGVVGAAVRLTIERLAVPMTPEK